MSIFRWFYKQLCALIEIFNMFEDRYEFESFQTQVRRVDERNWYQLGSNVKNAYKMNRKLQILTTLRVMGTAPHSHRGGRGRSTRAVGATIE